MEKKSTNRLCGVCYKEKPCANCEDTGQAACSIPICRKCRDDSDWGQAAWESLTPEQRQKSMSKVFAGFFGTNDEY